MKKILVIITFLSAIIAMHSHETGENNKREIPLQYHINTQENTKHRNPINYPINITYDKTTNLVIVHTEEGIEGYINLFLDKILIDYSPSINTHFYLPKPTGIYTIIIYGDNWEGRASIEL